MTFDIQRLSGDGDGPPQIEPARGAYGSPSVFTHAGQQDRRNEDQHKVVVREIFRDVERARLEVARRLDNDLRQMDADARLLSEQKYTIHRAQTESKVLAGEDPELQAKFAILDDDAYNRARVLRFRGQP